MTNTGTSYALLEALVRKAVALGLKVPREIYAVAMYSSTWSEHTDAKLQGDLQEVREMLEQAERETATALDDDLMEEPIFCSPIGPCDCTLCVTEGV